MKFKVEGKCKKGCYIDVNIASPMAYGLVFGIFAMFLMAIIIVFSFAIGSPEYLQKELIEMPNFIFVISAIVGLLGVVFGLCTWKFWYDMNG